MFPADAVACRGLVVRLFMVVDGASFRDLSSFLLAGEVVPSSFRFRLGSDGELRRYALSQKAEIVCVDEVVWKKDIAFVRLGRLKSVSGLTTEVLGFCGELPTHYWALSQRFHLFRCQRNLLS